MPVGVFTLREHSLTSRIVMLHDDDYSQSSSTFEFNITPTLLEEGDLVHARKPNWSNAHRAVVQERMADDRYKVQFVRVNNISETIFGRKELTRLKFRV